MSFNVEMISKENIKPITPTPYQFRNYSLSLIDQHLQPTFIPIILFYPAAVNDTDNKQHGGDNTCLLKRSLSETLAHFYPLAGRMKDNIVVECNDEGVEFIQVKVSGRMCDYLMKPDEQLSGLLPSEAVCMIYVREAQVIVQVNTFDCLSTAISLCVSHKIADVSTVSTFIRCWALTTMAFRRTTSIFFPSVSSKLHPTFDSASLFPPIKQLISPSGVTPTLLDLNPSEESKPVSKIISKRFVFDAVMINSVREKLLTLVGDNYKCRRPTRVEVVSALIWKSFVKLVTPGSLSVMVRHAVNLRKRIDPPLPDVSFGNLIEFTKTVVGATSTKRTTHGTTSSSAKLHDELNEFVGQLRESISKMNKGDHDFSMENTEYDQGRNLWMTSWCNYGLYDIDFGWGKPIWVTTVATMFHDANDLFFMNDTRCGQGIEVWGNLIEEDMENFQLNLSELLNSI